MSIKIGLIATLPPYVDHRKDIISHPLVTGLRFNSIMPSGETPRQMVARLMAECGKKRLWLDLKARQLRIAKFAYMPYAFVELNHSIEVDLPATILFKESSAKIVRIVDGNKLILDRRPEAASGFQVIVGDGEPVNILHPSLRILGSFLLDRDREYIEAAKQLGLHSYMLSFMEQENDLKEVLDLDPEAEMVAKIESKRGLRLVKSGGLSGKCRLMAARDDLYINMGRDKTGFLDALDTIIKSDPEAIVASRLLTSLQRDDEVSSQDISDVELMLRMGFRTFMFSDGLCFREKCFKSAVKTLKDYLSVRE